MPDRPGPAPCAAGRAGRGVARYVHASGGRIPCAARAGAFRRDVRGLLRAPFTRQARRDRLYVGLSSLVALAGFLFVVVTVTLGVGLSLSFAGMLVGVPLLVVALLGARYFGAVSRGLASRLVGLRVAPPRLLRRDPGPLGWIRAGLTDRAGWRACLYLLLKLPLAVLGAIAASLILVYGIPYLTFPLWWEVIHQLTAHGVAIQVPGWLTWWRWDPVSVALSIRTLPPAFALVPVGAAVILTAPWSIRALIAMDGSMITRMLGPSSLPERVRELEQSRARRWTTRRPGCAGSSATCTTALRRRWWRWP